MSIPTGTARSDSITAGRMSGGSPVVGGLEQFDEVAGRVGDEELAPARSGDQVAAEGQAGFPEAGGLGLQVVDDEVDAVAARGLVLGGGGAGAGAGGAGEQQAQRPADHLGEAGGGAEVQGEAEVGGVEVDGG